MSVDDFVNRLKVLAQICNFNMPPFLLNLYDRELSKYGYEKLCHVAEDFITKRKTRDPFPSIADFKSVFEPPVNAEDEAIEASSRIIQAISKFGWCNANDAREFIGELGWRVVERFGGWMRVCETVTPDNVTTLHAQFRNISRVNYSRALAGRDNVAPVLPFKEKKAQMLKEHSQRLLKNGEEDEASEGPDCA